MGVEVTSLPFSPVSCEPLDSTDRPNTILRLLFLLLPVLGTSLCVSTPNWSSQWFENGRITYLTHGCSIFVEGDNVIWGNGVLSAQVPITRRQVQL